MFKSWKVVFIHMQPGGAADDEHQRRMVPVELWRLVDYLMRKGLDEVRWGIMYLVWRSLICISC